MVAVSVLSLFIAIIAVSLECEVAAVAFLAIAFGVPWLFA
jgi:hypothetical protein